MACNDCSGNNTSPCGQTPCGCDFEVETQCVRQTKEALSCIGSKKGDTLDTILKKINDKLCDIDAPSYVSVTDESPGDNCENGGVKIQVINNETGLVTSTNYVCNGGVVENQSFKFTKIFTSPLDGDTLTILREEYLSCADIPEGCLADETSASFADINVSVYAKQGNKWLGLRTQDPLTSDTEGVAIEIDNVSGNIVLLLNYPAVTPDIYIRVVIQG